MRKLIIAVASLAALAVPTAAMADVTNNETTNDAQELLHRQPPAQGHLSVRDSWGCPQI
jgi:hypothetical protein